MAGGYGLQFQPGVPQNGNGAGDKTRGRVQEPVQVLSTRLPKIFGAGAIAPPGLLNATGGMGMPGAQGNVVAQALAQLAGLPPSMSPSGGMPTPLPSGSGMFGLPGLQAPSAGASLAPMSFAPPPQSAPPPPPFNPPPPYSPPPPRITPGYEGPPPRIVQPEPPGPPPVEEPLPPITRPPHEGFGDIQIIADELFRKFPQGVPSGLSPRLRGDYY